MLFGGCFLVHLTSIKIDDDEYQFIQKYRLKIKDIFKIGLVKTKLELLSEAYELLAKTRQNVYTIEQKIYILEQENIYKSQKIYTIEDILKEYIQSERNIYTDNQNKIWLQPRIERLQENGCAKTFDSVLEYCKNNKEKIL